jgi:hypothetical protein
VHGGIDVNLSLSGRDHDEERPGVTHGRSEQREIAFPGGIRREFIRSAIEYDEQRAPIQYWYNTYFDFNANSNDPGRHLNPRLQDIPCPWVPDGIPNPTIYWEEDTAEDEDTGAQRRELRDIPEDYDTLMLDRENGDNEEIKAAGVRAKHLSGDDAPSEGHSYALSIFGTPIVLTCIDDTKLVLDVWQNKATQRFRLVTYAGRLGFICSGANGGKGRYLGYNSHGVLNCAAYYQRGWENVELRADPAGGFMLWMDDRGKVPVSQTSYTELRVQAPSTTRFSFTKVDIYPSPWEAAQVHHNWGHPPSLTDCPVEGGLYAILLYGTERALTCVDGTSLRLRDFERSAEQRFQCTLYQGHVGFICKGADNGGRYLGFDGSERLACQAYYQRDWEHIEVRPDTLGGFTFWMKKDSKLAPVAKVNEDELMMRAASSTRFGFRKVH